MNLMISAAMACCLALGVAGVALAEGTSAGSKSSKQAQGQAQAESAPVVLIVPMMTARDQAMANGCWARLYDSSGFMGNMLTLSGPVDIPSMESGRIAGFEWDRNFDSVHVGPGASLRVWQGSDYKDNSTSFRANQRVQDLDSRMGYFEDIQSIKLGCTNAASGGSGKSGSSGSTR